MTYHKIEEFIAIRDRLSNSMKEVWLDYTNTYGRSAELSHGIIWRFEDLATDLLLSAGIEPCDPNYETPIPLEPKLVTRK